MSTLRDELIKFRNITLELDICLESEDYDRFNYLLDEREKLIGSMKEIEYDRSRFTNICSELKILELQEKLNIHIRKKQEEIKSNIGKISAGKTANNSYTNNTQNQSVFFNKKI